jgi:high-affinity iron transporter
VQNRAANGRTARALGLAALLAALLSVAVPSAHAQVDETQPWKRAGDLRSLLADAEKTLIIDGSGDALPLVDRARPIAESLADAVRAEAPIEAAAIEHGASRAADAVRSGDTVELAAARADVLVSVFGAAYKMVGSAIRTGDARAAADWLLVREFRTPTRFSRPGADATLALGGLDDGSLSRDATLAAVQADLLDTYQARLRASLDATDEAVQRGFHTRAASEATLAAGYAAILLDAFRLQRGAEDARALEAAFADMRAASIGEEQRAYETARSAIDEALTGFRAAPLSEEETQRRAGQYLRFLALVPIEYERGVKDGRVTLDFEIQEAITFRDGAAQALGDLEYVLIERDPATLARMQDLVDSVGVALAKAARGEAVAEPAEIEAKTSEALDGADRIFPDEWKETSAADFDVIRASLDRVVNAAEAGEYAKAEQARLEAYAFFEFGPEQRLRGIAPNLFVRSEGLFWYGADEYPGLAQLIKRKASGEEVAATRKALDQALADAEAAVGAGPGSTISVITNTAIIVFREGLEAVLILAALTAGMVGVQRRYRRPLLLGAAAALIASVVTFVIAQTVLESLTRYGEKLEAIVSLIAIAVLLLILNWFFHKVYWSDHLAELHGKKRTLLRGAGLSLAAAQLAGLAMLGFSAVYREGFETVLFLQAIVLEAGVASVVEGVLLGLVGVAAVAVLTIFLQRKLPHRRMLELTGILILVVLVIMVGKTVQVCQVVGWLPVHPIEGVRLPYWAGAWFGVFPTWEGVIAQAGAVVLVLGSYFGAELLRARKRARILTEPLPAHATSPESRVSVETPEHATTH